MACKWRGRVLSGCPAAYTPRDLPSGLPETILVSDTRAIVDLRAREVTLLFEAGLTDLVIREPPCTRQACIRRGDKDTL